MENEQKNLRLSVLPNHKEVGLPDIEMTILATNQYDINLISQLKADDRFVMSFANADNVYGNFEEIILPNVRSVGTICKILEITPVENGIKCKVLGIAVTDLSDFQIDDTSKTVMASCASHMTFDRSESDIYNMLSSFVTHYQGLKRRYPNFPSLPDFTQSVSDSKMLPYHIAAFLNSSPMVKQQILEERDTVNKIKILINDLERFNLDSQIEFNIQQKVSQAIDKNQREYVLREKMRVVKDQLKEFDGDDSADAYQKKIDSNPDLYPENIKKRVKSELSRLKTMPSASQEVSVITNYVDLLVNLPWKISTSDIEDLALVKKTLDKNHYGLEKQKDRIMQYLAVKHLTKSLKAPILCFYGAPGVGKTSLAISIAESLGRKFTKVALGGISDEAEIRGHRKTYVGAMPGKIISSINKCGSNNPVFLFDEIDKINGGGYHGDPASALLEVLDPEQNRFFMDNYLDEPFDLSNVLFICTANDISKIPAPLFDRLEMIELNTYTKFEKVHIAKDYLIPLEEKANGIKEGMMKWTDEALDYIVEYYTPNNLFTLDCSSHYRENYPRYYDYNGLRIYHIDSRLINPKGEYYSSDYFNLDRPIETNEEFMTLGRIVSSSNTYSRSNNGEFLIEQVTPFDIKTYQNSYLGYLNSYRGEIEVIPGLFTSGDVFNFKAQPTFFNNSNKLHNKDSFNFSLRVESISETGANLTIKIL